MNFAILTDHRVKIKENKKNQKKKTREENTKIWSLNSIWIIKMFLSLTCFATTFYFILSSIGLFWEYKKVPEKKRHFG